MEVTEARVEVVQVAMVVGNLQRHRSTAATAGLSGRLSSLGLLGFACRPEAGGDGYMAVAMRYNASAHPGPADGGALQPQHHWALPFLFRCCPSDESADLSAVAACACVRKNQDNADGD